MKALWLLCCVIACFWGVVHAQESDLQARLKSAKTHVKAAFESPVSQRDASIREALNLLRPLPKEQRVPLTAPLSEASGNSDPIEQELLLGETLGRIDSYLTQLNRLNPKPVGANDLQQQLKAIYDSPEMQPPPPSALERFFRWFGERIEAFFRAIGKLLGVPALGAGLAGAGALQYVVIGIVILLLALVGTYLFNQMQWRKGRRTTLSQESALLEDARALTPEEWRSRARQKASQGDYREAARCLYQAALHTLNANGYLQYEPARTNWEHAHQLLTGNHREMYDLLRLMTLRFDLLWYGGQEARETDWRDMERELEQLMQRGGNYAKAVS